MSDVEIDDAEWANPGNWYWELFYFSRRDSRPFVPKRGEEDGLLGTTVNLARPAGVLFLGGIFAFAGMMYWLTRDEAGALCESRTRGAAGCHNCACSSRALVGQRFAAFVVPRSPLNPQLSGSRRPWR